MKSIIIAYPIKETALQIKKLLNSNGLYVSHICATGSSVLGIAADLRGGIIVCASILRDTTAGTLAELLPCGFDIVALSRGGRQSYSGNYVTLPLPIDKEELVQTVMMLVTSRSSYTERERDDDECISSAKAILMSTSDMTELQAHKHLQQLSMKNGKKITEVAREIINDYNKE